MEWVWLTLAIGSEVAGTLMLKLAVRQKRWYGAVGVGYILAFVFLAATLRAGMGIGAAYAIWTAAGVALTPLFSRLFYRERLTTLTTFGLVAVIAGVVLVEAGAG
jgi:small multidrug resistance pump